ncbi:MAG: hypothetical protein MAG551_01282 [Candidatus Scalindua arabica]|uniref:Uncharacterized protein n=1 Tax=Candidatus Scalindua arabica TaxID=1127984 RepID=A0A941W2A8_9BACT|nr:hypothetical protein [Candidatus Scalindua arabica]
MKNLILIIVFLLLCPSLVLAEEEGSISDGDKIKANYEASINIANEIFLYQFMDTEGDGGNYGKTVRMYALLFVTGYKNLAEKVLEEEKLDSYSLDVFDFDKYKEKYKYYGKDSEFFSMVNSNMASLLTGYRLGMINMLSVVFATHTNVAGDYKVVALEMYEDYLEDKRQAKEEESKKN